MKSPFIKEKTSLLFLLLSLFVSVLITFPVYVFSKCPGCSDNPTSGKVKILYFYRRDDPLCTKVTFLLENITLNFSYFRLEMKDMSNPEVMELRNILDKAYNLRITDRLKVPAIFVGKDVFIGYDSIYNWYRNLIVDKESQPRGINSKLVSIYKNLKNLSLYAINKSLWTVVIIAGLIDGINPCAISVLIFLVSSLSLKIKRKLLILIIGLSFILGTFVTYFITGLGFLNFIKTPVFSKISDWFYLFIGSLSFLLGVLSVTDYYKAKNNSFKELRLQLPVKLKKFQHMLIRSYIKSIENIKLSISIGFILGFLLSIIELACTGQVYLPTLTLISNPWNSISRIVLLLLYNLMFILPLILVVISAFFISSNRISNMFSQKVPIIKVLTACLFFALSAYMFGVL